ncbi:MAG: hypothetical protein PHP75_08185, partial [Methylacidiphilaceae bacterium]|nr:hypothetical protein [Candidatus Methylacidiphilaceae bacterium]
RVDGLPWDCPDPAKVVRFEGLLQKGGCRVTVRTRKGEEIYAACGQLRLATLQDSSPMVQACP